MALRSIKALLALAIVTAVTGFAATNPTPQTSSQSTSTPPVVLPLFIEDGNFTSTAILVNGSAVATFADVSLRSLNGTTVARRRVQFPPYSQQPLNIRDLLNSGTAPGTMAGSIIVTQSPDLSGRVIVGTVAMTRMSSPLPSYVDEEPAVPNASGSQTLHGVVDPGDGSPLVGVTSLASQAQQITITCLTGTARATSKTVTLAPSETLLTSACTPEVMHGLDPDGLLAGLIPVPHGSLGVTLTTDAPPGSFLVFGLAPHRTGARRYFSSVLFSDPGTAASTTTVFAGVPVGQSPLLPDGS